MRHFTRGEIRWPLCLALRESCSGGARCFFRPELATSQPCSDSCDAANVRPVPLAQTLRSGMNCLFPSCATSVDDARPPLWTFLMSPATVVTLSDVVPTGHRGHCHAGVTSDKAYGQWWSGLARSVELLFLFGGHCTRRTGFVVFVPLMFLGGVHFLWMLALIQPMCPTCDGAAAGGRGATSPFHA